MKNSPPNKRDLTSNPVETGLIDAEMIHRRAKELALIAARPSALVAQTDYEQAKRDLTGQADIDTQAEQLESNPEGKRWDPVSGSEGRQAPESPSEEEGEEDRSEGEQFAEEGVGMAERDQML